MTTRQRLFSALFRSSLIAAVALCIALPGRPSVAEPPRDAPAKQPASKMWDKVTLRDGREFVGNITAENDESVTMEVVVAGIKTKLSWAAADILEISRDSVKPTSDKLGGGEETDADPTATPADSSSTDASEDSRRLVDVIPIRGELGFDAFDAEIKRMWKDGLNAGAKTVILNFDGLYCLLSELDDYRDLFQEIKDEAADHDVEVLAYVTKANYGSAAAFIMMFEDIYCHPDSIMGRGEVVTDALKESWQDEKVRAKMISAWTSHIKGMAEEGEHDSLLCEAMVRPELELSMSFVDGKAVFYRDDAGGNVHKIKGDVIIDASTEAAVALTGSNAVEYGVARGLASSLSNLIEGKLGYREYRLYKDGKTADEVDAWINGWAGSLREPGEPPRGGAAMKIRNIMADIAQVQSWGLEPAKSIGRQIALWEDILSLARRFPPVAKRPYGLTIDEIQFQIEQLRKQARDLRNKDGDG